MANISFEEHINKNGHILFWQPKLQYRINSEKVLGMDLDWTIIKPIKGKIHPIDENDWEFLNEVKLSRIKNKIDNGYKFVIFTNQARLLNPITQMGLEGFKNRWIHIYNKLQNAHIYSVYLLISLYDDYNRKPSTGMWEFMISHLNNNIHINYTQSIYIGDMAGRIHDYSNSDLLFAMNLNIDFLVPETFYNDSLNSNSNSNKYKIFNNEIFNIKIFNSKQYIQNYDKNITAINQNIINNIKTLLKTLINNQKQYVILFVGSPSSGKTTFYNSHLKNINNLIYFNNDTFNGTNAKFLKAIEIQLMANANANLSSLKDFRDNSFANIIIDNTNGTIKSREKYINLCNNLCNELNKQIEIIIIKFNTSKIITLHLNALRTKTINACVINGFNANECKYNVPAVAIYNYWKHLEEPDINKEKFNYLFEIEYEPIFSNDTINITQTQFELLL